MNKQDLIARIVKDTGATKTQAARIVTVLLASVTKALKKGETVTFVGFGSFKTSVRKARKGRNPLTGGTIRIPKRKAVRFSAGKALKKAVN
jgi:DNA-binding protein HU-beta